MVSTNRLAAATIAAALAFALLAPARIHADTTSAGVTADQLAAADSDGNTWLTYGRDLAAQRYSPLNEITAGNVATLSVAWKKNMGPPVAMEATPVMNDGTLYATTGFSQVYAYDAATGAKKWSYQYSLPPKSIALQCCDTDNRGVTLTGDKVITGTLDAHLVALDAATGKVDWNTTVAPNSMAYAITSPPLPVKNMVVTGVGGGEYPTRGFIAAYDSNTGKQLWKTYTVPAKGEPGSETWQNPNMVHGGAPTWLPGTYDPETNTIFWGTGNPNPDWDAPSMKGSLLYSSSVLALDADTGKIKWYFQFTPHDIWDYDSVAEPMLVDVPINGTTVKAIAHADRNGFLYLLDRTTGKAIYARPYLDKITWGTVDPKTGVATENPTIQAMANARKKYTVYPSIIGGKNWQPTAYDPTNHILIIPSIEGSIQVTPQKVSDNPKVGAWNGGGGFGAPVLSGSVSAFDLTTGKRLWKNHYPSPMMGGALTTASGIVFIGQDEGKLDALDVMTGKQLASFNVPSGINAPPMTYSVNGKQYVAVEVGLGGVVPKFFKAAVPSLKTVKPASMLYVYSLGQTAKAGGSGTTGSSR